MSAFCGVIDLSGAPAGREELGRMAAASARRGPDGERFTLSGQAGLCHLPLLATAESLAETQPLGRDGDVLVVADARLDNREELVAALDAAPDAGDIGDIADTEIILRAYLRWGERCPERLLGDFAFAIWDAPRRRLLCACDPLGVRTLHHARAGSRVVFGSEAQQVLAHPAIPRRLDDVTVGDFLAGLSSDPARTFFRDVHRLPPAHRLIVTPEGERVERYWDLDPEARIRHRRDEDYAACFLDLLRQSVEDRLRTRAGSLGILMSGGLDSSSVAAVARSLCPEADLFSGSFVFERLQQCDEWEFISATARHLGLGTELVPAESFPLVDAAPGLESPSRAGDAGFRAMMERVRARGARVLLTGHGGDDLLTGTPVAYADRLRRGDLRAVVEVARHAAGKGPAWRWILYHYLARPLLPDAADRALRRLTRGSIEDGLPEWIDPGFARRTAIEERLQDHQPGRFRDKARQTLYSAFRQSPWSPVCEWYDRGANAFGIEVRHPFLDRRLAEYLFAIPPDRLFRAGESKPLLRQAMAGLLPEAVRLRRDKTRLGAFLDLSLQQGQRDWIDQILREPRAVAMGFLDGDRFRAAYLRYRNGGLEEGQRSLWYALMLEIWLRQNGPWDDPGVAPVRTAA